MFGYGKRIKDLENLVHALRTDLNHLGNAQRHTDTALGHAQQMSVPRVRDGEKVEPKTAGAYPGSYREHLREIPIATAVRMLADRLGVELVYHEGTPGELRVMGIEKC